MLRTLAIILTLVLAASGTALAQGGVLDSIFGQGGLGIWGGGDSSQFNAQQYYGPPPQEYPQPMPGQQPGMQSQGYPQGYPQQDYQYPQTQPAPYGSQPGVNAEWYYPPPGEQAAPAGPPQAAPPPVRYTNPPAQAAPMPQAQAGPPAPYMPGQAPPPPRPGQYNPNPGEVEDLPAGAVRVTTTTPDGTTVQFYPPEGQPQMTDPRMQQQQPRRPRTQGAKPRQQRQPREQTSAGQAPSGSDMSVAMPKPVEIPQGQDPRSGWSPR